MKNKLEMRKNPMELMQVIKKRKSIRKYAEGQIKPEELEQILFAGKAAPVSRKDYDSIHITVVQSKGILDKISSAADFTSDPLYGVPTLIIISTTKAEVENIEYFNVACIVENMLLEATNLGIGSIFLTYFLQQIKQKELWSELGIPDGYHPISAVGVGYPADAWEWVERDDIGKRFCVNII